MKSMIQRIGARSIPGMVGWFNFKRFCKTQKKNAKKLFLIVCKRYLQLPTSACKGTLPMLDIISNQRIICWVVNLQFVLGEYSLILPHGSGENETTFIIDRWLYSVLVSQIYLGIKNKIIFIHTDAPQKVQKTQSKSELLFIVSYWKQFHRFHI